MQLIVVLKSERIVCGNMREYWNTDAFYGHTHSTRCTPILIVRACWKFIIKIFMHYFIYLIGFSTQNSIIHIYYMKNIYLKCFIYRRWFPYVFPMSLMRTYIIILWLCESVSLPIMFLVWKMYNGHIQYIFSAKFRFGGMRHTPAI